MPQDACTLHWPVARLQDALAAELSGCTVHVLAHTDSTNSQCLARARQGDAAPCLLVAEEQSAGRGRQGRAWQSAAGESLTFSLALPLAPQDWSGLSLAVGVALAEALEPVREGCAPRLQLKWPNDLWLRDGPGRWRKLGGILIETVAARAERWGVIGVGLNVLPPGRIECSSLASGHACVQELDPAADAPATLWRVALPLLRAALRFEREGLAPFLGGYVQRDLLRGQPVQCWQAAVSAGVAEGVDGSGALLVRAGGVLHRVLGGEVGVRPLASAQEAA